MASMYSMHVCVWHMWHTWHMWHVWHTYLYESVLQTELIFSENARGVVDQHDDPIEAMQSIAEKQGGHLRGCHIDSTGLE